MLMIPHCTFPGPSLGCGLSWLDASLCRVTPNTSLARPELRLRAPPLFWWPRLPHSFGRSRTRPKRPLGAGTPSGPLRALGPRPRPEPQPTTWPPLPSARLSSATLCRAGCSLRGHRGKAQSVDTRAQPDGQLAGGDPAQPTPACANVMHCYLARAMGEPYRYYASTYSPARHWPPSGPAGSAVRSFGWHEQWHSNGARVLASLWFRSRKARHGSPLAVVGCSPGYYARCHGLAV
eukprot:scaffold938_cov399-Prasinococcus_capsulatus_cf.AAC.6